MLLRQIKKIVPILKINYVLPLQIIISDQWQRLRRKLPDELQTLTNPVTNFIIVFRIWML